MRQTKQDQIEALRVALDTERAAHRGDVDVLNERIAHLQALLDARRERAPVPACYGIPGEDRQRFFNAHPDLRSALPNQIVTWLQENQA